MKPRKLTVLNVLGFIVDPEGFLLTDNLGQGVVYTGLVGRYLLTSRKRDTHLLARA